MQNITLTIGPDLDIADLLLGLAHCENTRVALYGAHNHFMAEGIVTDANDEAVAVLDRGEYTVYALADVEHVVIGSVPLPEARLARAMRG